MSKAKQYTLDRDGQRPLTFAGTILAESSGVLDAGREHNRYYVVTVFTTAPDRTVVHWQYTTRWQGELLHSQAEVYPTMDAAATALEAFNPCAWVVGYRPMIERTASTSPAKALYSARQASLERDVRERYAAQVSHLLHQLGVAERLDESS